METVSAPAVSICVPTYNGRDHLKECIDSIRAQTFRDFEVIICDDQSSDGTLDLARELTQDDNRFRCIANPRRFGLVGNWNNCIAVSRGEWIKFVFQDDLIAPACVEKLLRACETTGKPFSFCARDFIFGEGAGDASRQWASSHQADLDSKYAGRTAIEADEASRTAWRDSHYNSVGEPTVTLIRKSLFQEVGLFDEALIQLCDIEMWHRIMSNVGGAWVSERLAAFRLHAKATTAANARRRAFRAYTLDNLIQLYHFSFDPHLSRFRSTNLNSASPFSLKLDCAAAAYRARRDALRSPESTDEPAHSLLKEWNAVTSYYPRLNFLAGIGLLVAGYRYATRAAGHRVKNCGLG